MDLGPVGSTIEHYLSNADRLLPGRVTALYVVGSAALGTWREGRSDVDFVAVIDRDLTVAELQRLRCLQMLSGALTTGRAVRRGLSPLAGTCNGVFIRESDLSRPVSEITPVVSHTGWHFAPGRASSDVSPVAWKVLAERGVPIRGRRPSALRLDPQPDLLRSWNLANLESYWRPWAVAARRSPRVRFGLRPRWMTAWGVLGPPRLHHTIATGDVISKEAAGEYALDVFPARWHRVILEALAYRRMEPDHRLRLSPAERATITAGFVLDVLDDATTLVSSG